MTKVLDVVKPGVIAGTDSKTKSILVVYNNYYTAIPTNPSDLVLTNKRKEDIE